MGLAWQQGPLAPGAVGHFLVADPLPHRLLFAEPLRRRMRVRFADRWVADSDDVILLHEPRHYPVAYFLLSDVAPDILEASSVMTQHRDLGSTTWYSVTAGNRRTERAAWRHTELPGHARILDQRVAFAWRAMDAFYEEDERIVGHAADPYHRIDIRQSRRAVEVRSGDTLVALSTRPLVLYESGFAPRWYVPRGDVRGDALNPIELETFCPYKGVASYYEIDGIKGAAWSYEDAWPEVARISGMVSFEPDKVQVWIEGTRLLLEPGQTVISHGPDRNLTTDELGEKGVDGRGDDRSSGA